MYLLFQRKIMFIQVISIIKMNPKIKKTKIKLMKTKKKILKKMKSQKEVKKIIKNIQKIKICILLKKRKVKKVVILN